MKRKLLIVSIVALLVIAIIGFFAFSLFKAPEESVTGAVAGPETSETPEPAVDLSQIKEGLTKAEVLDIAGEPLEKQSVKTPRGHTIEYWYYEQGKDVYQVAFDSDIVSAVRIY